MKNKLKSWMLPISIMGGIVAHEWIDYLTPVSLVLIFLMLTITYCRINPKDFKVDKFHWVMLGVQMLMATLVYLLFVFFNPTLSVGLFICVFIPTATAAPIVTGMLGGSIVRVATYSLLCNVVVALIAPFILAAMGNHTEMTFFEAFGMICKKVLPLLLCPMILAFVLRVAWRRGYNAIASHQSLSFYLWAIALFIVVGSSVSFVIRRFSWEIAPTILFLAVGSAAVCVMQFYVGRKVGQRLSEPISAAQSLGQKNTILAIWMCLTFLDPITSIAPAAYMAWHNIFNSWQLIHHKSTD